jgi:hypothetical protein
MPDPRWSRRHSEGRGQETERQAADERSALHYSIT